MAGCLRGIRVALIAVGFGCVSAFAANQTPTVSPVVIGGALPFSASIASPLTFASTLPSLHSFAKASVVVDGHKQWLLVGGMTNGIHDLGGGGFEPSSFNDSIHVIDPVTQQVWSRSLLGSGLTQSQFDSIATTNAQSTQKDGTLYVAGGYGHYVDSFGDTYFTTFDRLTAFDVPGLINWVKTGTGTAGSHIRQISDSAFRVTGGDMHTTSNGRTHLVFGQDYPDAYEPRLNGIYTKQVRSFSIIDDGTNLSVFNSVLHPAQADFRRRDLNVVPILKKQNGVVIEKVQALSGVFTESFGAWTVPVTIDDQGNATQPDPAGANTFKQGMNGYRCASIGLYSAQRDEMHTLLLGGISYQYFNASTGQILSDPNMPFVNDCTDVVIDAAGNMTQHLLGDLFPEILSPTTNQPYLLGAETRFFVADHVATFANGVIDLDALSGRTLIGYLYGGIAAVQPNNGPTVGSNALMPVYITVPEPACMFVICLGSLVCRRGRVHL